jgi:nitroreductase
VDAYLAIASKREVREYADRPLSPDVVDRILHAGRVAGSATNAQPWRFIVIEDPGLREQVAETVYAAAVPLGAALVVALALSGGGFAEFDAGRAAQNMMLAAWNEGVGSCPNGMPDAAKTGELLGVRGGERVLVVLAFGYPARPVDPEKRGAEEWIARANRKPLEEVVERA